RKTVVTMCILFAAYATALAQESPGAASSPAASPAAASTTVPPPKKGHYTLVSVLVEGNKFWLPSTLIVEQGEHVTLTLKNAVEGMPPEHGFAIPDFKVQEIVTRGQDKTIEFVADKAGVFPYYCQLHAAHIG